MSLTALLSRAAELWPDNVAVAAPDQRLSYRELDAHASRFAMALRALGVVPGDRVGIRLPKGVHAVAAMQGILRIGAVYVPVDPVAPVARARTVVSDCAMKALVAPEAARASLLSGELAHVKLLAPESLTDVADVDAKLPQHAPADDDLAYILYTSGSTGKPKGVCISHRNALAFIDWAAAAIGAKESDRFASHAPFHFDLSVLDLYVAFSVGGSVHIIPEGASYIAQALVSFMTSEAITVWYSVPSAIVLMMESGALLETAPVLRCLIFAGEPFPMKQLRTLRRAWPQLPMWNFYGPTETNVCTAYELGDVDDALTSIPIGRASCGDRVWAERADGQVASEGEEGELKVDGPTVFLGYFGKEPQKGPYATGDVVRVGADGLFHYLGRRDHMVKVRGVRVELGDIESALAEHALVREAAVMVKGEGLHAKLAAFLVVGDGPGPTLLDVKRHCAERLPRAMIPDEVHCLGALPRSGNGKVDRRALLEQIS